MTNIYGVLKNLNIIYTKHSHAAVFTVEDANKLHLKINACHSKNLFLRNKKGNNHYLVVMKSDKRADLKNIAMHLKEDRLSFASPERLQKHLKLTPGSVSPFGLINDIDKKVTVLIDLELLECEKVAFHPNINNATLEITSEDFKKFLNSMKNKQVFLNL